MRRLVALRSAEVVARSNAPALGAELAEASSPSGANEIEPPTYRTIFGTAWRRRPI